MVSSEIKYTPDTDEAWRVINGLWMLLDDIDTLDDAAKDDDFGFRHQCYGIQQKRWRIYNIEDPGSICKTPPKPVMSEVAIDALRAIATGKRNGKYYESYDSLKGVALHALKELGMSDVS